MLRFGPIPILKDIRVLWHLDKKYYISIKETL
jgi:hypothetical protein